jgi:hypothetical protein
MSETVQGFSPLTTLATLMDVRADCTAARVSTLTLAANT